MESIAEIMKVAENSLKMQNKECAEIVKFGKDGTPYVSRYTDEVANDRQVAALLLPFFEVFSIKPMAQMAYIATVINSSMTLQRLTDSVSNILSTWDSSKFGKPTPADIVTYDVVDDGVIWQLDDVVKMCRGIVNHYYDRCDRMFNTIYPDKFNAAKNLYFEAVRDDRGRIIRSKKADCNGVYGAVFKFTKKGKESERLLLHYLSSDI